MKLKAILIIAGEILLLAILLLAILVPLPLFLFVDIEESMIRSMAILIGTILYLLMIFFLGLILLIDLRRRIQP